MYIIAGPNGAGKTTLSYTLLPEILNCDEFINADEIARGISPLNPEKAAIKAGRIMLSLIHELANRGESFAIETTLASKWYVQFIENTKSQGYDITLLFLFLDSVELAKQRVKTRVLEGGHNIPETTIERRYSNGLLNFFKVYRFLANRWILVDNSTDKFEFIAEGSLENISVRNEKKWSYLNHHYNETR